MSFTAYKLSLTLIDFHLGLLPLFFHTGLDQAGLSATVAASIALLPEDLQGMFWANIGLIGGNTAMPGFRDRLYVPIAPTLPMGLGQPPLWRALRSLPPPPHRLCPPHPLFGACVYPHPVPATPH